MYPEDHPLVRAINEAMRTLQPVTLTVEEAREVYREIAEYRRELEAQKEARRDKYAF